MVDVIYDRLTTRNEFMDGDEAQWDLQTIVIPYNFIVFVTDTHKIKKGDGVHTFAELPVWIDLDNMPTGNTDGAPLILGNLPPAGSEGKIVIVDATGKYKAANSTLAEALTTINTTNLSNQSQDTSINTLNGLCILLDVLVSEDQNKIMIINGGKYKPSTYTLESLNNAIKLEASIILGITLTDIKFYTGINLLNEVEVFSENTIYYAKIIANDENHLDISYTLVEDNLNTTIEATLDPSIYKITIGNLSEDAVATLTATANNGTKTKTLIKEMIIHSFRLINGLYYGDVEDVFNKVAMDRNGNFIAVGSTSSEGLGGTCGLIAKFDKNMELIDRRIYGGLLNDSFEDIIVDNSNNYVVVGSTESAGPGGKSGLIIKFDENFSDDYPIISSKIYGSESGNEEFFGITVDEFNNYYVCGYTFSNGVEEDGALVIKFAHDLSITAKKIYSEVAMNQFRSIALDLNSHIICVGNHIDDITPDNFAIIVKFNNSLASVLGAKSFKGTSTERLFSVKVDSLNNYFVVGSTSTESSGASDGLLLKINQDLTLISKKFYGGTAIDIFYSLSIDEDDNLYLVGITQSSEYDILILKLNDALVKVHEKVISGTGKEELFGVCLDNENNLICVGHQGNLINLGAFITKVNPNLDFGEYTGIDIDVIFKDVTLDIQTCSETFVYADWVKAYTDSNLTLSVSTLTLGVSALNYINEIIS